MLVRFSVGNFLSFNEVQEFSMISGKVKNKMDHLANADDVKLLKFAALYGANAAGKSNLVQALDFAKSVIIGGLETNFSDRYFRLDDSNRDKPSYFDFEIKIKNKFFAYGFEILLDKNELVSEWLYEISYDKKIVIFERNLSEGKYRSDLKLSRYKKIKERMEIYSEDLKTQNRIFFLSEMNRNKDELYKEETEICSIKKVFNWFLSSLDVNHPDRPISNYSHLYNELDNEKIRNVVYAFATGITGMKIINSTIEEATVNFPKGLSKQLENDVNKMVLAKKSQNDSSDTDSIKKPFKSSKIKLSLEGITIRTNNNFFIITVDENFEIKVKTIAFEHGKKDIFFKFSEESDGTRRILDLIEILLTKEEGRVYVIDEVDRSLHPQLTYKFVETFFELQKEKTNQLIVTTHESTLLDFDLLRRDEIWFVEKNMDGESNLYSLEDYNERFDKRIDKAYLEGRYGGVPVFSTIFPVKGESGCG